MKLGQVFVTHAIVNAVFGLGFLAVPVKLVEMYGVELSPGAAVIARLFGAAAIGVGLILWRIRRAQADVAQLVVFPLFVAQSLGFAVYGLAMLAGTINVMGWGVVALYGALAAAYGYFSVAKQPAVGAPAPAQP